MGTGIRKMTSAAGGLLLAAAATPATAEGNWEFEVTPYLWAAGIAADMVVRGQPVEVDMGFSDVLDALDIGGAVLLRAQKGPWVVFTQLDYLSLSTDELEDPPAAGRVDQKVTMASLAFGREFASANGRRTIDVLVGARHFSVDTDLTLGPLGFSDERTVNDPIIMLRPSFQISERWRLNPTFAYAVGGDSETSWEMQPTIQFQVGKTTTLRFGYRKLHYELEADAGGTFDGDFHGPFIGFGGTFGGSN
jgi:hypothetical protein